MGSVRIKKAVFVSLLLVFILGFAGVAYADDPSPYINLFYGQVNNDLGEAVASGTIEAYINDEKRGELSFENGQYGMPEEDPYVKRLPVQGTSNDSGKQIQFKVKIGDVTYTATTSPSATLKFLASISTRQANLTLAIPSVSINGYAKLEKLYPTSLEPDHAGTQVKVTQGGSVVGTFVTASDGSYTVTGVAAGDCDLEFSHPGGSWRTTTKTVTVGTVGSTDAGTVTLNMGDMNGDGCIDISDLLWMVHYIGPVTEQSQKADVNGDGFVDISDLLRVIADIDK
jgi:hypothetical protein